MQHESCLSCRGPGSGAGRQCRRVEFLYASSNAVYAEDRDASEDDVLINLADKFGVDKTSFKLLFTFEETMNGTKWDFQFALRLGVHGFSTVVENDKSGWAYLTVGFQDHSAMEFFV